LSVWVGSEKFSEARLAQRPEKDQVPPGQSVVKIPPQLSKSAHLAGGTIRFAHIVIVDSASVAIECRCSQ
jgi:hypothetical protein